MHAQFALKSRRDSITVRADGSFAISGQIPRDRTSTYPREHRSHFHYPNRADFVEWAGKLPTGNYTAVLTVAYGEDRIETQQLPFSVGAQ